ncbi:hypothetical protein ABBQ38_001358 [Trebouxia sp. C0009 RCD-2024]
MTAVIPLPPGSGANNTRAQLWLTTPRGSTDAIYDTLSQEAQDSLAAALPVMFQQHDVASLGYIMGLITICSTPGRAPAISGSAKGHGLKARARAKGKAKATVSRKRSGALPLPMNLPRYPSLFPGDTDLPRYRSQMCRRWEMGIKCWFGNECNFAHGPHELQ